jgi:bacterioferritin-associated ferredoxin
VAHFNHSLHLKMGDVSGIIAAAIDHQRYLQPPGEIRRHLSGNHGNACGACHRGMAESVQVTPANLPQMADCLVCHTKIEAPYSCETCHEKGAELRPASHLAPGFADFHSSRQRLPDKSSCGLCHGRGFTCMGCH